MQRIYKSIFFYLILLPLSVAQPAMASLAEVVWTHFDGVQHQILFSAYSDNEWQQPGEVVYRSQNPIATPVIGTLPSGEKLLIWAETMRNKAKLMFIQSNTLAEHSWSEADVFSDLNSENLAPTLVTDLNGHIWVFWSSSSKLPSDVYLRRFDGVNWSEAKRIHSANQVPDNGANASLNTDGNVYLEWNTFDFEINDYRLDSKTYIIENPYPNGFRISDSLNPADIPEPDFIDSNARVVIHFPGNTLIQNLLLNN